MKSEFKFKIQKEDQGIETLPIKEKEGFVVCELVNRQSFRLFG